MRLFALLSTGLLLMSPALLCAAPKLDSPALEAVANLDLDRYAGRWYEIARKPNRSQDACAGEVVVNYTQRSDGRITVVNECAEEDGSMRSVNGIARIVDPSRPAVLEVRFAPAFLSFLSAVWGDYWVIDLDPDYGWAVIGEPERKYFWVLSRKPALDEKTLGEAISRAASQGYDLDDLIRTRQRRD